MIHDKTAYLNSSRLFWKLDSWEDDLRRRRRLVRNPHGSTHHEATQKLSSNELQDDMINTVIKEEVLFKQLKQQKSASVNQTSVDEDELLQVDEKDLDQDFSGPIRFSTDCSLVCGTAVVRGTLAVTHNAMLFDTDEFDESFSKIDLKVIDSIAVKGRPRYSRHGLDVAIRRESSWQMAFQRDSSDLLTTVPLARQSIGNLRLESKWVNVSRWRSCLNDSCVTFFPSEHYVCIYGSQRREESDRLFTASRRWRSIWTSPTEVRFVFFPIRRQSLSFRSLDERLWHRRNNCFVRQTWPNDGNGEKLRISNTWCTWTRYQVG